MTYCGEVAWVGFASTTIASARVPPPVPPDAPVHALFPVDGRYDLGGCMGGAVSKLPLISQTHAFVFTPPPHARLGHAEAQDALTARAGAAVARTAVGAAQAVPAAIIVRRRMGRGASMVDPQVR